MMELEHQVAIVTGAAQGLGRAIADVLAKEGARVVIADVNGAGGEQAAAEIQALGGQALALKTDVSKDEDVDQLVRRTMEHFGGLDILVNNAAYTDFTRTLPFHQIDPSEWDPQIGVTSKGVLRTCKAVIPYMIEKRRGRIINIASTVGLGSAPNLAIYAALKAAVISFTKTIASELASDGILVNSIAPGATRTPALMKTPPEQIELMVERIPLGRVAEPEEIAHMVAFLASEKASYISGQTYPITGGAG
jgi:NAD(P)-dependent dehydrogenase (short-subunit alcohol dehydrogenase family)